MSDLGERLGALGRAVELARGRLDEAPVDAAAEVVDRAGARLGLDVTTTVAALAGPTGAGKSTLFNALAGRELAAAGVRRPTTTGTTAAVWGAADPALLDWTGATTRHELGGDRPLVLLDLPDFDSVASAHRAEAERVVAIADLLVWVTDPQKYADAALHERYLRPLAGHGAVMAVVLNQVDRLAPGPRRECVADLRRLLEEDGLAGVPLLPVSAATGDGLEALRALLDERAAARAVATQRLEADLTRAATALDAGCGAHAPEIPRAARGALSAALADAAGVPAVTTAVARSHRRRGVLAVGWPPARLLVRLRVDPLRRLRIGTTPDGDVRTSLPAAAPVQRAQSATALRALAAAAAGDLPSPWPRLVRAAAVEHEETLPAALDRAVAATPLPQHPPRWWTPAGWLQHALAAAAVAGLLWLGLVAGAAFLRLEQLVPLPEVRGVALPTLLLAGGLLAGLVLALLARRVNAFGARRRARRAERALHDAVEAVAEQHAVAPVQAELAARADLCGALAQAMRR